jgi:hypothetical protein
MTSATLALAKKDATNANLGTQETFTAQQVPLSGTLTDAASIAWDGTANGQVVSCTLTAARAFAAPTNILAGAMYKLILTTAGFTPSWASAGFKFPNGTVPTNLSGVCVFNFVGGASNILYCEGYTNNIS